MLRADADEIVQTFSIGELDDGQLSRALLSLADNVKHNLKEPSAAVRAMLKLLERTPSREHGFLNHIFGAGVVACRSPSNSHKRLSMRKSDDFKLLSSVAGHIPPLRHPLTDS